MTITVIQVLPALNVGGVERVTLKVAGSLIQSGHRSIVISAGGRLVKELTQSGSEHIEIPIGKKSLFLLRYIPLLKKIFSDADIVHVRSRFPAWLSYLAWRGMDQQQRPGFITTFHGAYSVNWYSKIMTRGERVIAVSAYIHDYIISMYPDTDTKKIITIPEGVDPDEYPFGYQPQEQWLKNWYQTYPQIKDKYLLTLPGRITRRKGHEHFLKILSGLKKKRLNIHGLIVGGPDHRKGSYFEQLKKASVSMGLAEDMTFTGQRNDLREIMSISDIVLSISIKPESFGLTTLESLSMGIPVIAYDHGGSREILQALFADGLVEPNNIGGIIERVEKYYHAKPSISDQNPYLLRNMLARTIECYAELIKMKNKNDYLTNVQ